MQLQRVTFSTLALGLLAACGSARTAGDTIVLADYDTSCQQDSDCLAVIVGTIECCSCPNAAIATSDSTKYEADLAVAERHMGVCIYDCGSCPTLAPVCSHGTCGLVGLPAAACGPTACTEGRICVMDRSRTAFASRRPPTTARRRRPRARRV